MGAGAADEAMKYRWQDFSIGDMNRLELIHPAVPGSLLDGFLKKQWEVSPTGSGCRLTVTHPGGHNATTEQTREEAAALAAALKGLR